MEVFSFVGNSNCTVVSRGRLIRDFKSANLGMERESRLILMQNARIRF